MKKFLFLAVTAIACGPIEKAPPGESWEQFKARATLVVNGQELYVVERDILVSHEKLRAYYDAFIAPSSSPVGLGKVAQPLIVGTISGSDDIWDATKRRNLRYCVSDGFGSLKDRVVSEMWSATAAWEGAAGVHFIYDPSRDGDCALKSAADIERLRDIIVVEPDWVNSGAHATFPSDIAKRIVINYPSLSQGWPGQTSTAILTHEVGHLLGFRHEHILSGSCGSESGQWRALTPYDRASVMHYTSCNGVPDTMARTYALTDLDRQGAASVYGPGTTPNGTNAIDLSEFFVRQAYRDVLKRDPDAGGSAYFLSILQSCNGASACLASNRATIARGLLESPENRQQDPELNPASSGYNSAFITHCYTNFLRRQPSAEEHAWWLSTLNSGGDYNGVVSNFIISAEYRQRFGVQ